MNKVVYASDCSKHSAPALRYAYRLSRVMNAGLHVLHICTNTSKTSLMGTSDKTTKIVQDKEQELLRAYCDLHLKNELNLAPPKISMITSDSIAKAIVKVCDILNPILVIAGMKDAHSLRGPFSGNIAGELLNRIKAPLMVIPNTISWHNISTVVYATDFEAADVLAIKNLVGMARPYGALIKITHIPRKKEINVNHSMKWFKRQVRQNVSYPELVFNLDKAEDVESGLHRVIRQERADMLVMLERKHTSLIERLFHKDLVRTMAAGIGIPLLAFNKKSMVQKFIELGNCSQVLA